MFISSRGLTLSPLVSPCLYLLILILTSSSPSKDINILIALMSSQNPQLFPWFKSGKSSKNFSSATVSFLPPSTWPPDLILCQGGKQGLVQPLSCHLLCCPRTTGMKDLGREPRAGGGQGHILLERLLVRPMTGGGCIHAFWCFVSSGKHLLITSFCQALCWGLERDE